jgi:carbon monoxide dehydrogenase subunit G
MNIQTSAQITISADIERVFDYSIDCENLPMLFTGYQSIPAILSATTTDGLPLHECSIRTVKNSDGSAIAEIITTLQRPTVQAYKLIRGFKPPFAWLVRSASGKWLYEAKDSATRITWQFEFEMQNPFAYLVFRAVVKRSFQEAQRICLENLKRFVETGVCRRASESSSRGEKDRSLTPTSF